jgi:hypothetical protein
MVPRLNETYAKYAEQGLVIVGVTNENASLVDGSISSMGQTFPIAMVKGGSVDTAYGVGGFPTVVLVGPDGTVLSKKRHPEAEIIEALKGAVMIPTLEGRRFSGINKLIKRRQLGKAWKSIAGMLERGERDDQLIEAKEAIESGFAARFESAMVMTDKGAWGSALDSFERLGDLYAGFTRSAEADAMVKQIKKNPAAKDDLSAHSLLQKAKAEYAKGKKANITKGERICEMILAKYPETATASKAQALRRSSR